MTTETTTTEAAATCTIGRADYEERRAARIDRLHERAAAHSAAADAAYKRAAAAVDGIPFGQPNIRGCLTPCYKRHDSAMRQGMREEEAAGYAASRAEAAERNHAISSDDPRALDKLREKLAKMEEAREEIKRTNKALRSAGKEANPAWMLSNLAGNIKRVKDRIAALERRQNEAPPEGWGFDGGKVVVNLETNRLQIVFDERQDEATTQKLKGWGFRWSRWEKAWQRMLTRNAIFAAQNLFPKPAQEA